MANGSDLATVTVSVHDGAGKPVSGVQVQLSASGAGNTLSSPPPTDASGLTTATLSTTVAEAKTLTATLPQGIIPKSPRVTFVAGPVSSSTSSVTVSGSSFVADGLASAIVTVTARDAHNNPVSGKAVLLSATGSQNSITQPTATDAQGVAMGTLSSTKAEDKAISATVAGTTLVQKPVVQFTPGAAARLSFFVPPSTTAAGSPISPGVQVAVEDANGNRISTATPDITVGLASRPSGGVLSGTRTVAAVAGVATFSDLSINRAGSGYTLSASAAGLASATSTAFEVTPGPASRLVFSVQPPATAAVGVPLYPAVQVQFQDANGNLVNEATAAVTLALVAGNGALLSGTTTVNAVAGVATFANLSVDRLGTGYTLVANASGFTGATSVAFSVTVGAASRLAFVVQPPSTAQAGTSFSPAVQVAVQDAAGNRVPGDTRAISLSIGSNPGGGTLSGTVVVNAVDGMATFSNLRIDKVGTGYSLLAASSGLASSVSNAFDITPGAPSKLAFLVQPPNGTSGAALSPAVQVVVQDAGGNTVTSSSLAVSIALGSSSGATLSGTTTVNAVAGVAPFSDLRIDRVGSYTLVASGSNVSSATSGSFTIAHGPASRLAITTGPADGTAGTALSTVRVEVQDAAGNTVTGSSAPVTAALGSNPGGGALAGTLTVNAVAGVATFSNLRLDRAGVGYTLTFASGALTPATSGAFYITPGPAAALVFSTPPQNGTAGSTLATVRVNVEDAYGNLTGSSAPVSLAVATGPAGGTLAGTTTVNASSGVATFSNLRIDKTGSYTLAASSGSLTGATSTAFTISAGTPARLVFSVQPSSVENDAPITPAVRVAIQDGFGNLVPGASDTVSMAFGANPSGGNLYGNTMVNAVGGEATFSNLRIDRMGAGYTLVASSGVLTSATSAQFDVTLASVRGSRIAHHLTDMGQVDVPADLSAVPIGAYVENGDAGFIYYPGSGSDAGTFTIPGVPLQRYYLRYSSEYIVTSARNLDLGYHRMGRPDVQKPDAGTILAMAFTGMAPWGTDSYYGYTDTLQLHSTNANTWFDGLQDYGLAGNPPAPGDTVINQTIDYKAVADIYAGNLPDAAKGDRVTFVHLTLRDAGVGGDPDAGVPPNSYLAAVDSFTTSTLTIPNGGDAGVSGSFSPLPQSQSFSIDWKLDEATPESFGSFRAAVHPNALPLYPYFYLDVLPTGAYGFYGGTLDLVAYNTTPSGPQADQAVTFTYGNPFPTWERFAAAYMYFYNRVYVPKPDGGVSSTTITTYINNSDLLATFPASPLRPGVSPPRTPTINGLDAHADVTIDATPFIAWQAPARGAPAYYRLRFRELSLSGTGSVIRGAYTGYLRTTGTSVRVPPGMLVPGKMYVMFLAAVQTPTNLETTPYYQQFPYNDAFTLSGLLTVQ